METLPSPNAQRSAPESAEAELPLLVAGCQTLGLPLTTTQVAQFAQFYRALVAGNKQFNLTAITDYDEVQTKHFLDSLAGLSLLRQQWGADATRPRRCLDVGSGAGFPGVPLKIAWPALQWTLLDSTGKKVNFLRQLVADLHLVEVEVVQGRAEELGRQAAFREQFDLVTARAVAPLNSLVEYLLPLTRRQGLVLIYKGASALQELREAERAITILGGEVRQFSAGNVPFLDEQRHLLLIQKVRPTPVLYPRGQGLARKKPLI